MAMRSTVSGSAGPLRHPSEPMGLGAQVWTSEAEPKGGKTKQLSVRLVRRPIATGHTRTHLWSTGAPCRCRSVQQGRRSTSPSRSRSSRPSTCTTASASSSSCASAAAGACVAAPWWCSNSTRKACSRSGSGTSRPSLHGSRSTGRRPRATPIRRRAPRAAERDRVAASATSDARWLQRVALLLFALAAAVAPARQLHSWVMSSSLDVFAEVLALNFDVVHWLWSGFKLIETLSAASTS